MASKMTSASLGAPRAGAALPRRCSLLGIVGPAPPHCAGAVAGRRLSGLPGGLHVSRGLLRRRVVVAQAQPGSTPPSGTFLGKFGSDTAAMRKAAAPPPILPPEVQQKTTAKPASIFFSLLLAVVLPTLGGILISSFANPLQSWYRDLQKPSWEPPDWMFGAVWSSLYVLMGLASFLVWADGGWAKQGPALQLYSFQLLLNFLWPVVFFKFHQLLPGAAILGVLVFLVNATMRSFYAVNRVAGWLILPYQAWVIFAFALNLAIWRLNREDGNLPGAMWSATPRPGSKEW